MKQKVLLAVLSLMLSLGAQAQVMKGRIYYNGNMSVTHLVKEKDAETEEDRAQREAVLDEIYTMSVTIEFTDSKKMRCRMKIITDDERAKELGISWANRKLWGAQLSMAAKRGNYWSLYLAQNNVILLEDGSEMKLSEDGEQLFVDDDTMTATLKRIK